MTETLGEHAPSYATVKNWVAQFKCGDFSTCNASRTRQPKTMITLEIIDQIHEIILEDCWISAKSIAEELGISHEWVGSIIHEDLDMRKLSSNSFIHSFSIPSGNRSKASSKTIPPQSAI